MGNIRFTGQTQYPTRSQVGNVKVLVNCGGGELKELLKSISIVWSFTGGVNSRKNSNPADAEHFGIAVVEALSAGNVQRPNLCAEFQVIRAGKWAVSQKSSNRLTNHSSPTTCPHSCESALSGCIPVLVDRGGLKEIVENDPNHLCSSFDECAEETKFEFHTRELCQHVKTQY